MNGHLRAGRYREAGACLEAIARRGETWETWKWRGLLREKEGRLPQARACLREAIQAPGAPADLRAELERMAGAGGGAAKAPGPESPDGLEHILRITAACNQRCPFCFVSLTGRKTALLEIGNRLRGVAGKIGNKGLLTISGGEPASDSRLPGIIRTARRAGVRRFSIQTNAVYFSDAALVARLADLGVKDYFVSFHSHKPALYDRLTGSRGQFDRAVRGLKNILAAPGARVVCNVVVTAFNYADLPETAVFLAGLGGGKRPRPSLFFSMLNDVGLRKAPELGVGLEAVAPWLNRAVRAARLAGLSLVEFSGACAFPPCVLDDPRDLAPSRRAPRGGVRYAGRVGEEDLAECRVKRPSCRRCPHDGNCQGVAAEYARRFGLGALRPRAAGGKS